MALHAKVLSITAGSLLGLAFILFVVANIVPLWIRYDGERDRITAGLWQSCTTTMDSEYCMAIKCLPNMIYPRNVCNKVLGARAFVTLACIISGISAWSLFTSATISDKTEQILLITAKGLAFASLIMGIIGIALGIHATTGIQTGTETAIKLKWDAGAIIGIIAIIINCCGAIASLLIK